MVPAAIVVLEALPLTPNGKLDRRALPAPINPVASKTDDRIDDMEAAIMAVWGRHLGLSYIPPEKDFFELGGHSLLAIRLIDDLNKTFSCGLRVQDIFLSPNVRLLAKKIRAKPKNSDNRILSPEKIERNYPLSSLQRYDWILCQNGNRGTLPFVIAFNNVLNENSLQQAINQVFQRHPMLRVSFHMERSAVFQRINKPSVVDVQIITVHPKNHILKITKLIKNDIDIGFNLSSPPLARFKIYRTAGCGDVFLSIFHHIIFDAISYSNFISEVKSCYKNLEAKVPGDVDDPKYGYLDYVLEGQDSDDDHYRRSIYLKNWIASYSSDNYRTLDLKHDRKRKNLTRAPTRAVAFAVGDETMDNFERFCTGQGVTLLMGLVGAYSLMLASRSGARRFVVNCATANRFDSELQKIIGCLANLNPILIDMTKTSTVRDFLLDIRKRLIDVYIYQVPFQDILDQLKLAGVDDSPLFQCKINLLPSRPSEVTWGDGLTSKPVSISTTQSNNYDLYPYILRLPTGLAFNLRYSPQIFDESTIKKMGNLMIAFIKTLSANPSSSLEDLLRSVSATLN
jgi:acyl carrier protein